VTVHSQPRSDEAAASALGRALRESGESRATEDSELDRLLGTVARSSPKRASRPALRTWALVAAVATVASIVGGFEWHHRESRALTFSVNGVLGHDSTQIVADAERPVDLEFSDGSVFNLEPAARLHVESSSATGAHQTLVDGRTIAHVVQRPKATWSVTAGPFEVRVTGTRFGARWDAAGGRLSVELYEGSVQVTGGGFTTPISVHGGQRLEAGRESGNWLLTSLESPVTTPSRSTVPASGSSTPASNEPSPLVEPPTNVVVAAASANKPSSSTFDWAARLGRADFDGIVREATDFGIDRCFATCASGDLRMLADSARYLGRYTLAERSLLALRKRSPSDGANAAFLLARLEESRDLRKALFWYDKNLEEAPSGAYAAESWAGKMRMLLQTGGPLASAPAAEQYLERFPNGVHAARAREVLSEAKSRSDHP
jgi:transmembrane sensor